MIVKGLGLQKLPNLFNRKKDISIGPVQSVAHTVSSLFIYISLNCSVKGHIDINQVKIDPAAAFGLAGLPDDYAALLGVSGITKDEAMKNKDEVFQIAYLESMWSKKNEK